MGREALQKRQQATPIMLALDVVFSLVPQPQAQALHTIFYRTARHVRASVCVRNTPVQGPHALGDGRYTP